MVRSVSLYAALCHATRSPAHGIPGFQVRGWGVNRGPQIWRGGGGGKGSVDRHQKSVIMNTGAKGAEKLFEH